VLKRVVLNVLKVVAGIAAIVALFVPVSTFNQILIFFVSVAVLMFCFWASDALDTDKPGSLTIWPRKPRR
jgi:hypothetical protein